MLMRAVTLAVALALAPAAQAATLFADLGARPGVERLVEQATTIWTADPRIGPTFADTDLDRFKSKLYEQFCQLADGGCTYTGHGMQEAHRGLHLDTRQFNVLVEDLQLAMDRLGIPFPTQNRLLALLAPMYRDVVSR